MIIKNQIVNFVNNHYNSKQIEVPTKITSALAYWGAECLEAIFIYSHLLFSSLVRVQDSVVYRVLRWGEIQRRRKQKKKPTNI